MSITYQVKVDELGTQHWYLNGKRHREDGPAVIWPDRSQSWYLDGNLHREDGPAIVYAGGSQFWYLNGKFHREGGPAIVYADGSQFWYLDGVKYTEEEWKQKLNPVKEMTVNEISKLLGYEVKIVKG